MISPWYAYTRDEFGIVKDKIARQVANLLQLEQIISTRMQALYQQHIADTLTPKTPIMYIDCCQKGDDDIMFFLFKQCITHMPIENKAEIASKIIGRRTIVTPDAHTWNRYVQDNQLDLAWIFHYYNEQLQIHLQTNDPVYIKSLLNFEGDVAFDGLAKFIEHQKARSLYLYLDNIGSLSVDEQTRINRFLYSRWAINHDKWIHLKINNWHNWWKTRTSDTWHRVEATHDYAEHRIYEADFDGVTSE